MGNGRNDGGNIAREMASTPLKSVVGATATAIVEGIAERKANPLDALLGVPKFRLVANAKWYDDKNDKTKASMRVAFCDFQLAGGLTLSASVYLERHIEQRADGRYATTAERLSLPKGLSVSKDDATTTMHLEAVKSTTLDLFDAWKTTVEGASGSKMGRTTGSRVVESAVKLDN